MEAIIVVPVRYGSERLQGKPLLEIGGEPMVVRVWKRCCAVRGAAGVLVATDDDRIFRAVEKAGGEVMMTAPSHQSGTDRVAEAVRGRACDLVVNVQGDEPFLDPEAVEKLIAYFREGGRAPAATLATEIRESQELYDPSVVKVLIGHEGQAVYFSRYPIPYRAEMWDIIEKNSQWRGRGEKIGQEGPYFKHIGVYAFRPDFLQLYTGLEPTMGERAERLEQLRILEHGHRMKVVETDSHAHGVDTPEDLEWARRKAGEHN